MKIEGKLYRKCACCALSGKTFAVGVDIFWSVCPYNQDINDDESLMWHCVECDDTCAMEI